MATPGPTRLEYLLEATRNLRNALDLDAYLNLVTDAAQELTRSEAASILVVDESGSALRFAAAPRIQREVLRAMDVPVEGSIAGRVHRSGRAEIVLHIRAEELHFKDIDRATGQDTRSLIAVPLVFKGHKLGVLEAINRVDDADYTEEDVAILELLGAQAAILLYNSVLERKLEQAHEEMAALDRMKSDFIAVASHELRTPLGLVLGHASLLREIIEQPELHEQLDVILRAAGKLESIITDLSNVNTYQATAAALRSRMVVVNRVVKDVMQDYADEARRKEIALRADVGDKDILIEGDADKVAIALSNLVKNALSFTNPGGHIFITLEQVPGYAKLIVFDNGIGIPAKDLTRIFERFYQVQSHLTRVHGGMGLGLSVAKMMVEMHGGRIWAESMEGKGSSFTILLPIDPAQAKAAQSVFI